MLIPIITLAVVFALIAIRQIGSIRLQIWQIMLMAAIIVLVTGRIAPYDALKSINLDVILFLFGMFVIGRALEDSGYLSYLFHKVFRRAGNPDSLLLSVLFVFGLLSSFLMNDTVAIIGTPAVLLLAKKHKIAPKPLLLALAFSVTIGSVMSPIGNPQNLLIAISGDMQNPFITFFKYLLLPTIVNLLVAYFVLKLFFGRCFGKGYLNHSPELIKDHRLANLSRISLIMVSLLVIAKIIFVVLKVDFNFRLTYIALLSMVPILLFSRRRIDIIMEMDWHTLVFFGAMFVFMESVWQTGFFQSMISRSNINITSAAAIMVVSVILSQLLSNVPLVALYTPMLIHSGASVKELMMLAAGSTIAGNFLIFGAASNVIIIQNSEKRGEAAITFLGFAKIGVPLTIVNLVIYWFFLTAIP